MAIAGQKALWSLFLGETEFVNYIIPKWQTATTTYMDTYLAIRQNMINFLEPSMGYAKTN